MFSVLIPSYNRPEYLAVAVRSVLASTLTDFELIISDDCSPRRDEIRDRMQPFLSDARVRFHAQETNLREPANREFLANHVRGEWLLYLSDDDLLAPDALASLAEAIRRDPDVTLFTFGYRVIDQDGRELYRRRAPRALRIHRGIDSILPEFLFSDAFPYWFYQPASFCARRDVRARVKPNHDIGMGDDIMFLFDYVDSGGTILVVPRVLMSYRKVDVAVTATRGLQPNQSTMRLANIETRYRMLCQLERRETLYPTVRAVVRSRRFRERFLYDSVVAEGENIDEVAAAFGLEARHAAELRAYARGRHSLRARAVGYLRRTWFFIRMFGAHGVLEVGRVLMQRSLPKSRHAVAD